MHRQRDAGCSVLRRRCVARSVPDVMMVTLAVVVFLCCHAALAVSPVQCLLEQSDASGSSSDGGSSGQSSSGSGSSSPWIAFAGCTSPGSTPAITTVPPLPDAAVALADGLPPTANDTLECAAACGNMPRLTRQYPADKVQFAIFNRSCYCVNETAKLTFNTTVAVRSCRAAAIFRLAMPCNSINGTTTIAQGECGSSCSLVDGCCVPNSGPNPDELPGYYRAMIQWVAVVVIVLALLEAVVYGCLRRRAIRRRRPLSDLPLREKRDARELSERLLRSLPASPTAAQQPSIAEESCPICLDLLILKPSLQLPCGHNIHASCMRDFVSHQLMRSNDVACPMCRAPVVEQDESMAHRGENDDDDVRARAARIATPNQEDHSSL